MNAATKLLRQVLLTSLVLLAAVWASAEGAQWLLRWRAQHLLADIRSLDVNRSGWSDAQRVMNKWKSYAVITGPCTADACTYRVDLLQILPQMFIGYPDKGVKNWLPRLVDQTGLRSAAARGGFTVEHGVVTSKWFAEQVAAPVRNWFLRDGAYVPDLAVSSGEFLGFAAGATGPTPHPYRRVLNFKGPYGITVQFLPQEDTSEQAALLDFHFSCITQFTPCETEGEILPAAWQDLQDQEQIPGTR
jgi:hypothetical protein